MIHFSCRSMLAGLLSLLSLIASAEVRVPEVTTSDLTLLKPLRRSHPRLVALDEDVSRTRSLIRTDPAAAEWYKEMRLRADQLLATAPVKHRLIGPRLLDQSRTALQRVYLLGMLYRLDGDRRYLDRAEQELLTVCAFPDWNPSHFLDTAEMAHAVAIGYDWFYKDLSSNTRDTIRSSLIRLGLEPGMELYRRKRSWVVGTNNWNQVCNGGLMLGALAIADEEPEVAAFVLSRGRASLPLAMQEFGPDGGWVEGPGYWSYTVRYCAALFSGLHTALGTAWGLDEMAGFPRTGYFRLAMTGPTGLNFNWGDGGSGMFTSPALFWMARRYDQPVYAWAERQFASQIPGGVEPLDLLWLEPQAPGPKTSGLPLDWRFDGIHVATMREAWEDAQASFVALKGGFGNAPHSNLDLGTFVFEAEGERWAVELGADDYNLPGYFDKKGKRYTYYRLKTLGQNTLTVDGTNQDRISTAPLTAFCSWRDGALAVADLASAYRTSEAKRIHRGFALCGMRRHLLIQDEVETSRPVSLEWHMHTEAQVQISGSQATLNQRGRSLRMQILEPENARFDVESAEQQPPQASNRGITRVTIRLPEKTISARVTVLLSPGSADSYRPKSLPLADWEKEFEKTAR